MTTLVQLLYLYYFHVILRIALINVILIKHIVGPNVDSNIGQMDFFGVFLKYVSQDNFNRISACKNGLDCSLVDVCIFPIYRESSLIKLNVLFMW